MNEVKSELDCHFDRDGEVFVDSQLREIRNQVFALAREKATVKPKDERKGWFAVTEENLREAWAEIVNQPAEA